MSIKSEQALKDRYLEVCERLDKAINNAGRKAEDITLLAVSKFHDAEYIRFIAGLGQSFFGESYVQEGLAKQVLLADMDITWHFVGHLQTNKARLASGKFALIHGVDSLRLARVLSDCATPNSSKEEKQDILIQVNMGGEEQKSGISPDRAEQLAEDILSLPGVRLLGLMCLPPFFSDAEKSRPFFAGLRELRDKLEEKLGINLPCLSMGMSNDFACAIEEGASIVRIGTSIFGPRNLH